MTVWIPFDTETAPIRPGCHAPRMMCMTWVNQQGVGRIIKAGDEASAKFMGWLDSGAGFIGANTPFDMLVWCAYCPEFVDRIFKAYDEDRITDVLLREQHLDIAAGRFQGFSSHGKWVKPRYSLDDVSRKYGFPLSKPENVVGPDGKKIPDPLHVRLRFQELEHLPLEQWDDFAAKNGFRGPPPTQYAIEDAVATGIDHKFQEAHADPWLVNQFKGARKAFALGLISAWGVRTDAKLVSKLAEKTQAFRDNLKKELMDAGLVREDGSRDTKAAAALMVETCLEQEIPVRLTDKGGVCLDENACDATNDPVLKDYADYTRLGTVLSKDIVALMKGTVYPIHSRFGITATDRTTSSNPNMQNWGRGTKEDAGLGARECFRAREGTVFAQADYEGLELHSLSEVCIRLFGVSKLAETLNSGKDPHLEMASLLLGISYAEAKLWKKMPSTSPQYIACDLARQTGKVANFGFPGGMGAKKLVVQARKQYGVILQEDCRKTSCRCRQDKPCAVHLREMWLEAYPEMRLYFQYMSRECSNEDKMANLIVPVSGWMRGGAMYCAACNTPFQNLGAAAAGKGLWLLSKACYVDRKSILFGSRPVNHIHDENFVEVKDDKYAHDKAIELEQIMVKGANEFLPNCPVAAPPLLMRYWSKQAFDIRDKDNRLVAWNGEVKEAA